MRSRMDNKNIYHSCEGPPSGDSETVCSGSSLTLVDSDTSMVTIRTTESEIQTAYHILERLPSYLWTSIAANLDVVSTVCLQSTNRYFHATISVDRTNFTKCEKWMINRRFRNDMTKRPTIFACILCKCKMTEEKRKFHDGQLKSVLDPGAPAGNWFTRAVRGMPWMQNYYSQDRYRNTDYLDRKHLYQWGGHSRPRCYAHLMEQFGSVDAIEPLLPFMRIPQGRSFWLKLTVLRCLHCGECIAEGDMRLEGCLECLCNTCPRNPDYQ